MFRALKRWWRYLGTKLGMTLEQTADPKVQLEQAIQEAREQHRLLTESAANVIANQMQLQMRHDRAIEEYEKANRLARQALLLADRESKKGDAARAGDMTTAAESFADRIGYLESEVGELQRMLLEATKASDRARDAVRLNGIALRKKIGEREQLLSKLDQAKMQEQMNSAMTQLNQTVGDDVPTLEEVRDKIERRLASAQATTELSGSSVSIKVLEVEQAQRQAESQARLEVLRTQLGIGPGPAVAELSAGAAVDVTPAPATGKQQ
jgi:phage shock protein A